MLSCMATCPMDDGDTEESLEAEYLALTGEVYRTREEEAAGDLTVPRWRFDAHERKENEERIGRQKIADAKAKGFRDCNEIFDYAWHP